MRMRFILIDDVVPQHGLAVVRIVGAPYSGFRTVINHWRAREGHLKHRHLPQGRAGFFAGTGNHRVRPRAGSHHIEIIIPFFHRPAGILQHRENPPCVMRIKKVLKTEADLKAIGFKDPVEPPLQRPGSHRVRRRGKERNNGIAPHVIHDGIQLIAPQIGRGQLHDFAAKIGRRIDGFHQSPPFAPEAVRHTEGHIQPPAVNPVPDRTVRRHPAAGGREDIVAHRRGHGLPGAAQFRQSGMTKPAFVL